MAPRALVAGHDEYSLLDLYSGFFLLLVPYSENLLLGRVASNANKTSDVPKLDVDSKPFWFSCLILTLFASSNDKFAKMYDNSSTGPNHRRSVVQGPRLINSELY